MTNISLQNIENYKSDFTHSTTEIFTKYIGILNEYFTQCIENIHIKNIKYYKYILVKGAETVTHVFKFLLLYTKNLPIVYAHCQKSLYYYVEFICQIGEDSHSFLQLNSKDASLFVYKKSIFDINNEYRKEFSSLRDTCSITSNIELLIHLYLCNINTLVFDHSFNFEKPSNFIKYLDVKTEEWVQNILNLSLNIADHQYTNKLLTINKLYNKLYTKDKDVILYSKLLSQKLQKNYDNLHIITQKLDSNDSFVLLDTKTPSEYINWICD